MNTSQIGNLGVLRKLFQSSAELFTSYVLTILCVTQTSLRTCFVVFPLAAIFIMGQSHVYRCHFNPPNSFFIQNVIYSFSMRFLTLLLFRISAYRSFGSCFFASNVKFSFALVKPSRLREVALVPPSPGLF